MAKFATDGQLGLSNMKTLALASSAFGGLQSHNCLLGGLIL